jgi:hypothetical protein
VPNFSTTRPTKIYTNRDFWFENIPSGSHAWDAQPENLHIITLPSPSLCLSFLCSLCLCLTHIVLHHRLVITWGNSPTLWSLPQFPSCYKYLLKANTVGVVFLASKHSFDGCQPGLPDFPLFTKLKGGKLYQMTTKHTIWPQQKPNVHNIPNRLKNTGWP